MMDAFFGIIVILVFLISIPTIAIYLGIRLKKTNILLGKRDNEFRKIRREIIPLRKYQSIVDIDQAIAEKQKASHRLIQIHKTEANSIRIKAQITREKAAQQAIETLEAAKQKAADMLSIAQAKAEAIAGDALFAKRNVDRFESRLKAIKNIINDYGEEYLIPNHSVLDELAQDFEHKQAGQSLKQTRDYTKSLIKQSLAALCDYSETVRRQTAICFVLDAFNGKVDSILAKVRHNNFGKLRQEIQDAFTMVNAHGEAFRNARITDQYLASRQQELKWAVATHELKLQEREEQKIIHEAMREEEKAKKEIEKAIRDTEHEERLLQQAMEKAHKAMRQANDEERIHYEQELNALKVQLTHAEAKNQRALSMAQQTRRGHVYVISNEGSFGKNIYKIGMTRRLEPMERVKELGDASVPFPFDVHAIINSEDAPALENTLHHHFNSVRLNKVNLRKEFFSTTLAQIKQVIQSQGIQAHWTMTAEAIQYRESKAIAQNTVQPAQHTQRSVAMAEC